MPEARYAAQVVLAAGPGELGGDAVERARRGFEALGFRTGECVGDSFSIEAGGEPFRHAFGVALAQRADGAMHVRGAPDQLLQALPLQALPASLRQQLRHVVFSAPPAFGPGSFS